LLIEKGLRPKKALKRLVDTLSDRVLWRSDIAFERYAAAELDTDWCLLAASTAGMRSWASLDFTT
jgi:hypothetical protein